MIIHVRGVSSLEGGGLVGYDLGVDLGTTFVAAAVNRDRRVEMCTLGNRSVAMPATAYLAADNTLLFGDVADRRALAEPGRVAREFKRRLGDSAPVVLGGVPFQVTALMGALLRDVVSRVSALEGTAPEHVVLTHPANWGPFRREVFEEVPRLAGLAGHHTLTEPEAAAGYYASSRHLRDGDTVAVYDLGGGTFDATVLRKRGEAIELVGFPVGIERLGGIDFDEAIVQWVDYRNNGAISSLDLADPEAAAAVAKLRQECVLAKEALSVDTETTIPVSLPGNHFQVRLTRDDLEGMIRVPVESTIETLVRAIRSANVEVEKLSAVLLIGGSSRIPLIARMISDELGRPTVVDAHPKHAVALGAATVAAERPVSQVVLPGAGGSRPAVPPDTERVTVAASTVRVHDEPTVATPVPDTAPSYGNAPYGVALPAAAGAPVLSPSVTPQTPPPGSTPPGFPAAGGHPGQPVQPGGPLQHQGYPGGPVGSPAGGPQGERGPVTPDVPLVAALGGPPPRQTSDRMQRAVPISVAAVAALLVAGGGAIALARHNASDSRGGTTSPSVSTTASVPVSASPSPSTPSAAAALAIPSIARTIPVPGRPDFVLASPNGQQVYIADAPDKKVFVLDTSSNTITGTIAIDAGPPQFLTFSPDGHWVYVSLWDKKGGTIASVAIVDATDNTVKVTIPVHTRPYVGAVTPDGKYLWIPNHDSGTVTVIDPAQRKAIMDIPVAPNPHYVRFSPDGKLAYTADHESNLISVIDVATAKELVRIPVDASPHSLAYNPKRPLLINVNFDGNTVTLIDTTKNTVTKRIPVGQHPQNVNWSPDGRYAYVVCNLDSTLWVISADSQTVTATLPMGKGPTSIAVLPDGRTGYVNNAENNSLTLRSLATG